MSDGSSFVYGSVNIEHGDQMFKFLEMKSLGLSKVLINEHSSRTGVNESFGFNGFIFSSSVTQDWNRQMHSLIWNLG